MPTSKIEGQLSAEDTARLMLSEARRDALNLNPRAFSQNETIEATRDYYGLVSELIERYNIDESRSWHISQFTGTITYEL